VKFKLDENLPASATTVLAKRGHDVDTVRRGAGWGAGPAGGRRGHS
jgi:Domain of unknown function (DUF5615)